MPRRNIIGRRVLRLIAALGYGLWMHSLAPDAPAAFRPVVYAATAVASMAAVAWAFGRLTRVALLSVYTGGVAVVGLICAAAVDLLGTGWIRAEATGIVCLVVWAAFLVAGRRGREPEWARHPAWWMVPLFAIFGAVLAGHVFPLRVTGSQDELDRFSAQVLARLPPKSDRPMPGTAPTTTCEDYETPVALGTFSVMSSCVVSTRDGQPIRVGLVTNETRSTGSAPPSSRRAERPTASGTGPTATGDQRPPAEAVKRGGGRPPGPASRTGELFAPGADFPHIERMAPSPRSVPNVSTFDTPPPTTA